MLIMKKLLLGTTGLVVAAMFANASLAQTPKVTVGGFSDFQAGVVNDDFDNGQREHGFRNDTQVSLRVDGRSDAGLDYGAVIDLEADVTPDANAEGFNAARTYVYLGGNWGRFELGSKEGASESLRVDASSINVGTGGIDGAWVFFANPTGGAFITTPGLPTAHGSTLALNDESLYNANKITYYTPAYSGFQFGITYQPDMTDRGQLVSRGDNNVGQAGRIVDAGLSYDNTFGDVSLAAAATVQYGDSEADNTKDLFAYNVGANLGYQGFSLAGSYGDWGSSLGTASTDGQYWTGGLGYQMNKFGAAFTYLGSSLDVAGANNDFQNFVVGTDYKLAPGLTPYAEVSFYEFSAPGVTRDNEGTVFILGTQVAF
ncbi:MAG: porin [Alphaproteobacteria bacterium]|nr:MAG: porin [Alphaproteobacteria bacterium]TAF15064.1 MAG: porin [Alphaproteobacteria bacterium]TAF40470.1 MAG: porin [Alphaproteobacteria bacterium]TAF76901.1 MAG: porin [Alphaproteobacteria bacterium]